MRRAHRTAHFLVWLLLVPAMLAIAVLALGHKRSAPANEALPPALIETTPTGEPD